MAEIEGDVRTRLIPDPPSHSDTGEVFQSAGAHPVPPLAYTGGKDSTFTKALQGAGITVARKPQDVFAGAGVKGTVHASAPRVLDQRRARALVHALRMPSGKAG